MTTEEIALSEEKLRAMLAGCEGVPNGEWTDVNDQVPNIISSGRYWIATTRFPYTSHEQIGRVTGHILNCHPDTICSLVTELLALRAAAPAPSPEHPLRDSQDGLSIAGEHPLRTALLASHLHSACVDWDGKPMADDEEPRVILSCRVIREAADRLTALERERDEERRMRLHWAGKTGEEFSRAETATEELTASQAEVERLKEALKPFARIADMEERAEPESSVIVNVSRCRDARAALQPQVGK